MSEIQVHPSAIVSPKARLGENVRIGPHCIVEDDVEIGDNTELANAVVVADGARIGRDCRIFSGAVIATVPQDLKFDGEYSQTIIGDRSVIREYVTVNRGTKATGKAIVGNDCLIMAYCHVAHDCVVGNHVIMSNATQLAGHVTIHDRAILGGGTLVHQFCSVGKHTMIGAGTFVNKDVCHYLLAEGNDLAVRGLNKIGLRRRGFANDVIKELEEFYSTIFHAGYNVSDGIAKHLERDHVSQEVLECIEFIRNSQRGIQRGR